MIDLISDEAFKRIRMILNGVPGGVEKALKGVISRTHSTIKTTTIREITSIYAIQASDIRHRKNTTIKTGTRKEGDSIVGFVSFTGYKIPLYRFNVSPKRATPKVKQSIRAGILKNGPRKRFENAFIAEMKSGHMGVFERKPGQYMDKMSKNKIVRGKKYPFTKHAERIGAIKRNADQFYGPSTADMAVNPKVLRNVEAAAMDTVQKRTEHEIYRILHGYGGK